MTTLLQLSQMVTNLRHELGQSENAAHGTGYLARLKYALQNSQRELYGGHDWPILRSEFTKALAAGSRYYDPPSGLSVENIEAKNVRSKVNGIFYPLVRGINPYTEFNSFDSTNDERSDPARRWDIRHTGSSTQVEIWPIPETNNQTLYFVGVRDLGAFVSDSDYCTLDADLIVLWAAVNLTKDADDKAALTSRFQSRLSIVRSEGSKGGVIFNFGDGHGEVKHTEDRLRVSS